MKQGPFKPSDVQLIVPPLTNTMGRSEREHAATCIVRVCQLLKSDEWSPVSWREVKEAAQWDVKNRIQPLCDLVENPFFRPDIGDLVKEGFARMVDDGVYELTEEGIEALRKWT